VRFVMMHSRTTTILFRTTRIRKEWAERGETITQTISRQYIGGAMKRKDQSEWNELRPISRPLPRPRVKLDHSCWLCASCVPDFRFKHSQGGTQAHLDDE